MKFAKLDENKELDQIVKEVISNAMEKLTDHYSLYSSSVEAVESRSRDGFISSNDGGYRGKGFTDLSSLTGSGIQTSLPESVQTKVDELQKQNNEYALSDFKQEHKEALEGLNLSDEDLNYHRLYEINQGSLAEKLSEKENEHNSDESSSLMFVIEAFVEQGEPRSMHVAVAVNWEAPYHRSGKNNEWFQQESFEFDGAESLKEQLTNLVNKLISPLVG